MSGTLEEPPDLTVVVFERGVGLYECWRRSDAEADERNRNYVEDRWRRADGDGVLMNDTDWASFRYLVKNSRGVWVLAEPTIQGGGW